MSNYINVRKNEIKLLLKNGKVKNFNGLNKKIIKLEKIKSGYILGRNIKNEIIVDEKYIKKYEEIIFEIFVLNKIKNNIIKLSEEILEYNLENNSCE